MIRDVKTGRDDNRQSLLEKAILDNKRRLSNMEDNSMKRSLLKKSRINSAKKKKSERERLSRLSGADINDLLQTQPDKHRDSVDFGSTGELAL